MQVLTIVFTPGRPTADEVGVTFSAQWGARRTTGEFRLALARPHLAALLELLQAYAEPSQRALLTQTPRAQGALAALGLSTLGEGGPAPIELLPRRMGEELFRALFQPETSARLLWGEFYSSACEHPRSEHRLVLRFINHPHSAPTVQLLVALPWEQLRAPSLQAPEHDDPTLPFLLQPGCTLTLIRAYQPSGHTVVPAPEHAPTARPSILLLETHDRALASLAARVRPPELDQRRRLWCRLEPGPWPLEAALLGRFRPQIVHVIGHGLREESRNWLILGPEAPGDAQKRTGPYGLFDALKGAESSVALIASFVCSSGVSRDETTGITPWSAEAAPQMGARSSYSFLEALTHVARALLLMQGLIHVEDAVAGSEAFYDALARGEGLALAAHALRQGIHSRAEQEGRALDAGWWLPTLYMANPEAELRLVEPERVAADEVRRSLALPADLLARLEQAPGRPRLIVLQCQPKGGKSVRLQRVADHLRADPGRHVVELPVVERPDYVWLAETRRDLATQLRALHFTSPDYRVPEYDDVVCNAGVRAPLYILCDDGDRLVADDWLSLLPPGMRAPLVFVTTASQWRTTSGLPIEPELVPLKPLSNDELRSLQRPVLDRFSSEPPAGLDPALFPTLKAHLFAARTALSLDTLAGLAGCSRQAAIAFLEHAARHQAAFKRSTDDLYEPAATLPLPDAPAYSDFVEAVEKHMTSLTNQSRPWADDLLDIITHECHSQQINPLPYKDEDGPPWRSWNFLAIILRQRGQTDAFARIALIQARGTPYAMVRDGLYYLVLAQGKLIPPELYAGWLWHILWPAQGQRLGQVPSELAPSIAGFVRVGDYVGQGAVSDDRLNELVAGLEAAPDLSEHHELLAALQEPSGDPGWLERVYNAHRRAIANRIQQEYDYDLGKKRDQTAQDLWVKSNRFPIPVRLWEIAQDPDRRDRWLNNLQQGLMQFVLTLDADDE